MSQQKCTETIAVVAYATAASARDLDVDWKFYGGATPAEKGINGVISIKPGARPRRSHEPAN